jgi:hypothetical protein
MWLGADASGHELEVHARDMTPRECVRRRKRYPLSGGRLRPPVPDMGQQLPRSQDKVSEWSGMRPIMHYGIRKFGLHEAWYSGTAREPAIESSPRTQG